MKKVDFEGTRQITTVSQPHENRLYVQQDSKEFEKRIYEQNSRLRNTDQTGTGSVRMHLQMSEQDLEQLVQKYPLLRTGNSRQRRALWMKIARQRPELVAMEFKKRVFAGGIENGR